MFKKFREKNRLNKQYGFRLGIFLKSRDSQSVEVSTEALKEKN